jgi:hypothetical protein
MAPSPVVPRYPLSGTLACAAPHVPPALVTPEAIDRVQQVASWLPAALTSGYGFECRLGEATASADFALAVTEPGERRILAGLSPAAELPRSLRDDPAWRRVRDLCADWLDPASELNRDLAEIWLEFDLYDRVSPPRGECDGALPGRLLVPSVFVGPTRPAPNPKADAPLPARRAFPPGIARALAMLRPEGLPEPIRDRLHACLAALPPEGILRYAGMMLSRPTNRVRLCATLPKEGIVEYLTGVGWHGPATELEATVTWFARYVDEAVLCFDVGATIGPRVGIEGKFDNFVTAGEEGRWRPLLEALERRGLCTAAKREALLGWHGRAWQTLPHELWLSPIARLINHVKVVRECDGALEAKAYVGFVHLSARRGRSNGEQIPADRDLNGGAVSCL